MFQFADKGLLRFARCFRAFRRRKHFFKIRRGNVLRCRRFGDKFRTRPVRRFFATREIREEPNYDRHRENNRSRAPRVFPAALPNAQAHVAQARQLVARHLKHKRCRFRFQNKFRVNPRHGNGNKHADQIHTDKHRRRDTCGRFRVARILRKHALQHAAHQHINRHARAATHKRHGKNRRQARFRIFNRARAHDSGNPARVAGKHRHEAFSVQAAPTEKFIHQKRRPRHVAGRFEQAEEEKQNQDLRQENQHAADTRDDAVHNKRL